MRYTRRVGAASTDPALPPCQPNALLAFQTGCDEVADAAWCPSNATAFAAVTAGGRVEVRFSRPPVLMGVFRVFTHAYHVAAATLANRCVLC